jgi:hypothetical protein
MTTRVRASASPGQIAEDAAGVLLALSRPEQRLQRVQPECLLEDQLQVAQLRHRVLHDTAPPGERGAPQNEPGHHAVEHLRAVRRLLNAREPR